MCYDTTNRDELLVIMVATHEKTKRSWKPFGLPPCAAAATARKPVCNDSSTTVQGLLTGLWHGLTLLHIFETFHRVISCSARTNWNGPIGARHPRACAEAARSDSARLAGRPLSEPVVRRPAPARRARPRPRRRAARPPARRTFRRPRCQGAQ